MDEKKNLAPIAPDEEETYRAERKKAEEEAMKTAIFLGLILGCLIGACIGSLSKGIPIGIALLVIIELLLQKKRCRAQADEKAAEHTGKTEKP